MTVPLVECVPNFSEGRDAAVIAALAGELASVPGAALLDIHADRSHHRSVFTVAGAPDAVLEAAFRGVARARDCIDLRRHVGCHPRLGAADVVPIVPLAGVTLETCAEFARALAARIRSELAIPTVLYGAAALDPADVGLAAIRRRGVADGHPTAGTTCVGARGPLIAYNVELATDDVEVARRIAREIREADGGLHGVQALGFALENGHVQVSTNLLDLDATPPKRVFDEVRRRAGGWGLVVRSEIVGLVPERALAGVRREDLKLDRPPERYTVEPRLRPLFTPDEWLRALAAPVPAPGGGAAAAMTGALAAALVAMVARISHRRLRDAVWEERALEADRLRAALRHLSDADANAVRDRHPGRMRAIPREIAAAAREVERLGHLVADEGYEPAAPDARVAEALAAAAAQGADTIVAANT